MANFFAKERLLALFQDNPYVILTDRRIFRAIWGKEYQKRYSRTIRTYIGYVRQLPELNGMIVTIWGIGYAYLPEIFSIDQLDTLNKPLTLDDWEPD